ncbi:VOC family protein [Primorskyibacter sedentarius]|uniref:VOC family protein n=1 Tax=Primorskyibacter sedentarius TaxID=745311 RepID=UPI003EBC8F3A
MLHAPRSAHTTTDRLTWGVIELQVTDLDRAVYFWTTAFGLIKRSHTGPGVALGTDRSTLFVLHSGAQTPVAAPFTGMYHAAIGVRSQSEFSRMLARLLFLEVEVVPTDHLMAKSLYLKDPDGLEIEVTFETPERFGHYGDMSRGLTLYDADGRRHNGRGPLDVAAELAHAADADPMDPLASDSYLAHLHLKVRALEPALDWFEALGFERNLTLDAWGFADMGAGAPNTHRLAMNIWAGTNRPPAPREMAGLLRYELIAQGSAPVASPHLRPDGDVLRGTDPVGIPVTVRPGGPDVSALS